MSILTVAYPSGAVRRLRLETHTAYSMADALQHGTVVTITDDHRRIDVHPRQIEYVEVTPDGGAA